MTDRTDSPLGLLTLEPLGEHTFIAPISVRGPERLFGGQVAAQTLRAATLTVDPSRPPHSFHAYFLRPGRPGIPLRLDVEPTRDGRSFSTRHIEASQNGEPILSMIASFHQAEPGEDWQLPAPDVPGPDDVKAPESPLARFFETNPFDIRPVTGVAPGGFPAVHPFWIRVRERLPDDPFVHVSMLTFFSDMGVVRSARAPGSGLPSRFMGASLDHAVWFHRPARADEWLLFSVDPATNFGSRGLARGTMHTRDGVLVASIVQEALLRETGRVPLP